MQFGGCGIGGVLRRRSQARRPLAEFVVGAFSSWRWERVTQRVGGFVPRAHVVDTAGRVARHARTCQITDAGQRARQISDAGWQGAHGGLFVGLPVSLRFSVPVFVGLNCSS